MNCDYQFALENLGLQKSDFKDFLGLFGERDLIGLQSGFLHAVAHGVFDGRFELVKGDA